MFRKTDSVGCCVAESLTFSVRAAIARPEMCQKCFPNYFLARAGGDDVDGDCIVYLALHVFAVCYSGFLVIMHPSQMFVPEVKSLYNGILADSASSINLKIQILKNLQTYLQEEDTRMQEADRECK